jgi:ABC-type transporter Mla subunit MlaD
MTTPPPAGLPAAPAIPLSAVVKAAYQDLYNQIEAAIESTTDVTALQALNDQQAQIDDVLQKEALYELAANTDAFSALLTQFNSTNTGLKTLQVQINATASHFQTAAGILAAIDKVFGLLGIS